MARKGKRINFSIEIDIRKIRREHRPHKSGAGEHDSGPKREKTRERRKSKWHKDLQE